MPKALDLRILNQKTWELTLLDGSIVNIYKPNEDLRLKLESLKESTEEEAVMSVPGIVVDIMNNNQGNRVFEKMPNGMDFTMLMTIIREYTVWLHELMNDPN